MEYREPKWPKWSRVYDVWQSIEVPDVEVISFDIEKHYPRVPWFDRTQSRQYVGGGNPLDSTAYHVCKVLPKIDHELKAAYKLYAYCREYELGGFPTCVLLIAFRKHGSALYEWWNGNAKYVLPEHECREPMLDRNYEFQSKRWKELVEDAARVWTSIAQQWAVIRIPDWMDPKSDEYQAYSAYVRRINDDRERQEFERLRRKFDKS